jgi:hypothetical protein
MKKLRLPTVQGGGKLNLNIGRRPTPKRAPTLNITAGRLRRRPPLRHTMTNHREWDWPPAKRPHVLPEIIDADYRVIRQRPAVGFGSCVFIIAVAAIIVMRFFWPAVMLFAMLGVTSISAMLGVLAGLLIFGAAALHAKLNGRQF